MILSGGQRRHFLSKTLNYLFSHDLTLRTDAVGFVPGGFQMKLRGEKNLLDPSTQDTEANPSRAFHALGDELVLGNDAVFGTVVWFDERMFIAEQNSVGTVDTKLTVRTPDGALIWSHYKGRVRFGRLGYRRLLGDHGATSFEAKVFVAPRFETDTGKYRWLTERQCVAYGRLKVEGGAITSAAYDVYSTS
jgi:hypothetical protein